MVRRDPDPGRLGDIARVTAERHGAIRVGTPAEMRQAAQVFAALGMHPVGFYDLREGGPGAVPVVFTGGLGAFYAGRLAGRWDIRPALGSALDGALMLAREAA